jgi:DNA-binding MarR family transcriptional regulator
MHHQRCEIDRRSVRVRLTEKGREVRKIVDDLFTRHAGDMEEDATVGADQIDTINAALSRIERFWTDQIRCIY